MVRYQTSDSLDVTYIGTGLMNSDAVGGAGSDGRIRSGGYCYTSMNK